LADGRFGVAVGDVSGKGMPAALLMAVTTTAMRDEIGRTTSAGPLLNELNTRLVPRMKQNNMNSALLMTIFDPTTRQVEIANAGMLQPYVIMDRQFQEVQVSGYPLGASERGAYSARTLPLVSGALLLFITDGVTECQNKDGEFFGYERLE